MQSSNPQPTPKQPRYDQRQQVLQYHSKFQWFSIQKKKKNNKNIILLDTRR